MLSAAPAPAPAVHTARDPHADEAAFSAHVRELTARWWPRLGLLIVGGALLWWPLDRTLYEPATQSALSVFRPVLAAVDLLLVLGLPRVEQARERAVRAAGLATAANLLAAGVVLALGAGPLAFAVLAPFLSVLLVVPFAERLAWTLLFCIATVSGWLLAGGGIAGIGPTLGFLAFSSMVSVFIGHALTHLLRHNFFLAREVGRQRTALASLTGHLEQRIHEQTRALRDHHVQAEADRARQRQSIARDMHDDIGQELVSMRLLVGLGRQLHDEPEVRGTLDELEEQVGRVQRSLRRVLVALRPPELDEAGLVESLQGLLLELRTRSGLDLALTVEDLPTPLAPELRLGLYRIAQEALNNAIRHARARRVDLRLWGSPHQVCLEVSDDGRGLPPGAVGSGMGTAGILERTTQLGGTAHWHSDGGTRLRVELPRSPT